MLLSVGKRERSHMGLSARNGMLHSSKKIDIAQVLNGANTVIPIP